MKETETGGPTPEELLQILDAQLVAKRSQGAASSRNRAMFLVGGLLFILVAAGVALFVLDQMLSDLRQNGQLPQAGETTALKNF
jgi:uncharacterized membrane protein